MPTCVLLLALFADLLNSLPYLRLSIGYVGCRLGRCPLSPQLLRAAERYVQVELEFLIRRREPQVGQPLRQKLERDAGLQPGKRRPEAEVDAVAERYVFAGVLAADVQGVGVFEGLSSRLAEARSSMSLASSGTSTPAISTGRVVERRHAATEVSRRSTYSTAFSIGEGYSRSSFHSPGRPSSWRRPLTIRFVVVSWPAKERL